MLFQISKKSHLLMGFVLWGVINSTLDPARAESLQEEILANQPGQIIQQLRQGANPNQLVSWKTADQIYSDPLLFWAIRQGHLNVVETIVSQGGRLDFRNTNKEGMNALMLAVASDQPEIVAYLLRQKLDVNLLNAQGQSALMLAAQKGNLEIFKQLIASGADLNIRGRSQETALSLSMAYGHLDIIKYLHEKSLPRVLQAQIDLTLLLKTIENGHEQIILFLLEQDPKPDPEHIQPMIKTAAKMGHLKTLKWFQSHGFKLDFEDSAGLTPLIFAASAGQQDTVAYLIAQGADLNATDKQGKTAFMYALEKAQWQVAKYLMAQGAHTQIQTKWGVLMAASAAGQADIVELLISQGVELNAVDSQGYTAERLAAEAGHKDLAQRLRTAKKDPLKPTKQGDMTSLFAAMAEGRLDTVQTLYAQGLTFVLQDEESANALMQTISNNHEDVLLYLLSQGLNLEASDTHNLGVFAAVQGHLKVLKALKAKGLDFKKQDQYGRSLLMYAAESGHQKVGEYLIAQGVDVNAQDFQKMTALMHAVKQGHFELVKLLCARGANVNLQDVNGSSVLMHAAEKGDTDIAHYLIAKGANKHIQNKDGFNALMIALQKENSSYYPEGNVDKLKYVKFWCDLGLDVNSRNKEGVSTLRQALEHADLNVVDLLLSKGADLHHLDSEGRNILMQGRNSFAFPLDKLKYLQSQGLRLDSRDHQGKTFLMYTAQASWNVELLRYLLEQKILDVNARDHNSYTALMYAAEMGHLEPVVLLIAAGADPALSNLNGQTAETLAREKRHDEVAKYLKNLKK